MRKFYSILVVILFTVCTFAQVPQKMSYQAVIRNSSDKLITNQAVGIKISVLKGSAEGIVAYTEIQTPTTNSNGLVSIEIGGGIGFDNINWGNDTYYIKIETDPLGGTNYSITGTSQLLSVPYSLYSGNGLTIDQSSKLEGIAAEAEVNVNADWNATSGDAQILNLPTLSAIATSGSYTDLTNKPTTVSGYGISDAVTSDGNQSISGNKTFTGKISANNNTIVNVANPINTSDAANKAYVDELKQQIKILEDNLITAGIYQLPDIEGNKYDVVRIGTQTWMAENLKTSKYNDGTSIPLVTDGVLWPALSTPGYCWYNNDESANKVTYGALYNWHTVNTGKLCPVGWSVPTDTEWKTLEMYLGMIQVETDTVGWRGNIGNSLKSTSGWSSSGNGNNESGFNAIPGGYRYNNGDFNYIGSGGFWWSRTNTDIQSAWYRLIDNDSTKVFRNVDDKHYGFSVRCLKDSEATIVIPSLTTSIISSITSTAALSGGNITNDGGGSITARGVSWSTSANPTIADNKTTDGTETGEFSSSITGLTASTTYYVRAYASNSVGTAYGNEISFATTSGTPTLTDASGNSYNTVTIGTQIWMAENLKTDKYNDETSIPLVEDASAWAALSTPGYCWYNNDITVNKETYGALYNSYAVKTSKLCPSGWHIPTDAEWKTLEIYLGMTQEDADATAWRGTDQGTQLKNTSGWNSGENGTNTSGFSALPGGMRDYDGTYYTIEFNGYWWSSETGVSNPAGIRRLYSGLGSVNRWNTYIGPDGFSVRCLRD